MDRGKGNGESGQSMAEYAILAGAIAAACSIAILFLSGGIGELFGSTSTPMKTAPFRPPSTSSGLTYPTTLAECANGGWKNFPQFTSEAKCVEYVESLAP